VLIQRLQQFAQHDPTLRAELAMPAFEQQPVRWLLVVDQTGNFQGLVDRIDDDKKVPPALIPKVGARTVAPLSNLAVDNAGYVLGPSPETTETDRRKLLARFSAFTDLMHHAAAATGDAGLQAAATFYDDPAQLAALRTELALRTPAAGDRYAFTLAGDDLRLVCNRPAAMDFSALHVAERSQERGTKARAGRGSHERVCLCCGRMKPPADRHMTKIMGVPDGQASGTSLISFNASAFESYGWEAAFNSPTCGDCVEAYSRAMNRLLQRRGVPRTRLDEGGAAILYWTLGGEPLDLAAFFEQPDPEAVRLLLTAPRRGDNRLPAVGAEAFCTVVLAGAGGRVMVRAWLDTTIEAARTNLGRWFADLQMVTVWPQRRGEVVLRRSGEPALPPSLRTLLGSLVRDPRRVAEDVPKNLPAALLRAALTGGPLPAAVLAAAVHRLTAENGNVDAWRGPARLGLIRAALNRSPVTRGGPVMTEALDREQVSPGYLCGRLLAVLEAVQYAAVGDVGADIVDRFYGRAASAPRAAFPILLRLAQSHLRTVKRDKPGLAVTQERELQEILGKLPGGPGFPAFLPLEEQGRFALGFYHQRAERFRRHSGEHDMADDDATAGLAPTTASGQ